MNSNHFAKQKTKMVCFCQEDSRFSNTVPANCLSQLRSVPFCPSLGGLCFPRELRITCVSARSRANPTRLSRCLNFIGSKKNHFNGRQHGHGSLKWWLWMLPPHFFSCYLAALNPNLLVFVTGRVMSHC